MKVPFNRLRPVGREAEYVAEAISSGALGGTGKFAKQCEALLRASLGSGEVLLTCSATAALEMAVTLAEVRPGDEVIMPSFNFVSAANAALSRGARVIFADVTPDTLNLCPDDLTTRISDGTKAIIPIDYAGVGCDLDRIKRAADLHGATCIEDAAQGVGSRVGGRPLGSDARLAVYSFHESKNLGCGEGGALIINDPALVERALHLRDKGTNRQSFLEGKADKYTWVDTGSSYAISELSAAFLLGQIEQVEKVTQIRVSLCDRYADRLSPLKDAGYLRWNNPPLHSSPNGHIFYVLLDRPDDRDKFISFMNSAGIQAFFHYVPLHLSPMGRKLGYTPGDLPVTEHVAARLVRLPLYASLGEKAVDFVVDRALEFFGFPV